MIFYHVRLKKKIGAFSFISVVFDKCSNFKIELFFKIIIQLKNYNKHLKYISNISPLFSRPKIRNERD